MNTDPIVYERAALFLLGMLFQAAGFAARIFVGRRLGYLLFLVFVLIGLALMIFSMVWHAGFRI